MSSAQKSVSKLQTLFSITLLFFTIWCLTVLAALCVWALFLYQGWDHPATTWITNVAFTSFPLVPAVLTALAWWAGLRRRPVWAVTGALLLAPVMVYLATDDAEWRSPISLDDVAPSFPGEKESEAVILRYAKVSLAAKIWQAPAGLPETWLGVGTPEWEESVKTHAAAIGAAWSGPNPLREWWDEWSSLPRLGDSTSLTGDTPGLDLNFFRSHVQLATAEAGRLALAGQGDAAFAVLEPLLIGSQKLSLHGRSTVRLMIGSFCQRLALKAVPFVLEHASVSPEARARLGAVLAEAEDGEKCIRRYFAAEYAHAARAILVDVPRFEMRLAKGRSILGGILDDGFMDRVLINPKRTANRLHEMIQEAGELAVQRDAKGAGERAARFIKSGGGATGIKNIFGGILGCMVVPNMEKVISAHWEVVDRRVAVLATLRGETATPQTPPTAATTVEEKNECVARLYGYGR